MFRTSLIATLALGIYCLHSPTLATDEPAPEVCHIRDMEIDLEQDVIRRGGNEISPVPFLPLRSGDILEIRSESGHVRIRCGADERVIKPIDSPFTVESVLSDPSKLANALAWASDYFREWLDRKESVTSLTIRGSDDPIEFPLLHAVPDPKCRCGDSVSVAWRGGHPPYSVFLMASESNEPVTTAVGLSNSRVRLEPASRPLESGRYSVVVKDSNNKRGKATFFIADEGAFPIPETELTPSNDHDLETRLLDAIWLAGQSDGKYSFEAYQEIAILAKSSSAATIAREALENGFWPVSSNGKP